MQENIVEHTKVIMDEFREAEQEAHKRFFKGETATYWEIYKFLRRRMFEKLAQL